MFRSATARLFAVALVAAAPAFVSFAPAAHADAPAAAATYKLDESHTTASFAVRHLGVSNVYGQFGKVAGTITFDGKDTSTVKADITIDAASVDTRNEKRDTHLKSPDFFDVAKFPSITFKSKSSTAVDGGKFKLTGDLTLHGVTKEVVLVVDAPSPEIKHPMMPVFVVGSRATLKINRKDFGIGPNMPGMVVSEDVSITIDLEADRDAPAAAGKK